MLDALVDEAPELFVGCAEDGAHRLDHRAADGAGIIEGMRVDYTAHVAVNILILLIDFGELWGHLCQQTVALQHVVAVGLVASGLKGGQHARVGDAPLIAGQAEAALLQLGVGSDVFHPGHLLPCFLVYQHGRCLSVDVFQYTVHRLLHALCCRYAIADAVGRLHQVERGVVVVDFLSRSHARSPHQQGGCHCP